MPIQATVFIPPNGQQQTITMTEINDADAEWFTQHNIKISLEELRTGVKVVYADYGDPDNEAVALSATKPCRELMAELRVETERLLNQGS